MSVLKGLNRSDVYLTDYNSQKWWSVPGTNLSEFGIKVLKGVEKPLFYFSRESDIHTVFGPSIGTSGISSSYVTGSYNEGAVYGSIKARYYSGSFLGKLNEIIEQDKELVEGTGSISGNGFGHSGDLYLQSTLSITGSRTLPSRSYLDPADTNLPDPILNHDGHRGVVVISFPEMVIGTGIQPGTFKISVDEDNQCYVEDGYVEEDYFEDLHTGPVTEYEGVLLYSGFAGKWHSVDMLNYPTPAYETSKVVGDIIYSHGQVIFTNEFLQYLFNRWDAEEYRWQSNWPRFTKHITCKVQDVDFNYTLNPTAPIEIQNDPDFTPYITSLGLYNNDGELVAVAKFSKPIKKPSDTDMTFDIQIDLG